MSKSIQLKDKNNEKYYPHPYYPVGSIYLSVNNTNPTRWFGGTWELIAQGRTLVGVDTNDTDFNTVRKTGGEKKHTLNLDEIPSHYHDTFIQDFLGQSGGEKSKSYFAVLKNSSVTYNYATGVNNTFKTATANNVGNGQAHNNLQPYFTCYIWCRTA